MSQHEQNTRSYGAISGVEVFVNDLGNVVIKSDEDTGGPVEIFIQIPPERIDDVCRWLQECKAEALETRMERVENAV